MRGGQLQTEMGDEGLGVGRRDCKRRERTGWRLERMGGGGRKKKVKEIKMKGEN